MIKCKTNGTFRIGQQIMICSAIKPGSEGLCGSTGYCKHQSHIINKLSDMSDKEFFTLLIDYCKHQIDSALIKEAKKRVEKWND